MNMTLNVPISEILDIVSYWVNLSEQDIKIRLSFPVLKIIFMCENIHVAGFFLNINFKKKKTLADIDNRNIFLKKIVLALNICSKDGNI